MTGGTSNGGAMIARPVANVVAYGLVLWLNGLAGSGAMSGESIGLIANRYPSAFLPANYVFGIWGLIYASLFAFVLYQLMRWRHRDGAAGRIGWWWIVSCVLNVGWIVAFSFSRFGTAMVLMVALLIALARIHQRIGRGLLPLSAGEHLFVAFPFSLYLSWILVAVIANSFQYVNYLGWSGAGTGATWSAVMMVVATAAALGMVAWRGDWVFPLVTAWAFLGIADRYPEVAVIATTAKACAAAGLVGLVTILPYRAMRAGAGSGPLPGGDDIPA